MRVQRRGYVWVRSGRAVVPATPALQPRRQPECGIQFQCPPDCRDDNRFGRMRIMVPNRPTRKSHSKSPADSSKPSDVSGYVQYGTARWTEMLIELVFENQALYNHTHTDYRNSARRDQIWESIGSALQTTAEDAKRRWRSLRDTYSRIIRNRLKKGLPERGAKKWTWADKMEPLGAFLPNTTYGGDTDNSGLLEVRIGYESGSVTQDSIPDGAFKREPADLYSDDADSRARGTDETGASPDNGEPNPSSFEINLATSSSRKRLRPDGSEDSFGPPVGYFENGKRAKMDPLDLLFLAHASTVKTFSARRQAVTKLKIAEVIMQEELNHQEEVESVNHKPNEGKEQN